MGIDDIVKNAAYKAFEFAFGAAGGIATGYWGYSYSVANQYATLATAEVTGAGLYLGYHVGKALASVPVSMMKGVSYLKKLIPGKPKEAHAH